MATTITGLQPDSTITYNNIRNITYQGTQARDTDAVYNNVENIRKEAVELNNSYSSSSSNKGISAGATIGYGHKFQTTGNGISLSAGRSNSDTTETIYANGNFQNVNEVHNNTRNMVLRGFNQEGGKVTGNIGNLEVISLQNKSTTTGSSSGISVGISSSGIPNSIGLDRSSTDGERAYVDNQSTFIAGEGSSLTVGKAANTGAVIGTEGSGVLKINEYTGKDLNNYDTMRTTGGSIGLQTGNVPISNMGYSQDSRDKEGVARNTVVGNVEIGTSTGAAINRDLSKANEVTRDVSKTTNINVESQTIEYAVNPGKLKEDIGKAKQEIADVTRAFKESINDRGDDNRNFFGQLSEVRLDETVENIAGEKLKNSTSDSEISEIYRMALKDLGYDNVQIIFSDPKNSPQLIDEKGKPKSGTAFVDGKGVRTIIINAEDPKNSTRSGLIGTFTEEGSHIIGKIEGRQIATGTDEKGLESTGRATNEYFQNKYKGDDTAISIQSDGKDYSDVDFGEHVGDKLLIRKTDFERLKNDLGKFTDYKYDIKNCNSNSICEIKYLDNSQEKKMKTGNEIVKDIIDSDKRIMIDFNSKEDTGFYTEKEKKVFDEDAIITIDNMTREVLIEDSNGNIKWEESPKWLELGHEMGHTESYVEGTIDKNNREFKEYWYTNENGKKIQEGVSINDMPVKINTVTREGIDETKVKGIDEALKLLEKNKNEILEIVNQELENCKSNFCEAQKFDGSSREEIREYIKQAKKVGVLGDVSLPDYETESQLNQITENIYNQCSVNNSCPRLANQKDIKEFYGYYYLEKQENAINNEKNRLKSVCANNICFSKEEFEATFIKEQNIRKETNQNSRKAYRIRYAH